MTVAPWKKKIKLLKIKKLPRISEEKVRFFEENPNIVKAHLHISQ